MSATNMDSMILFNPITSDNYKLSIISDFQLDEIRANANQSCIGKSGQDFGNP